MRVFVFILYLLQSVVNSPIWLVLCSHVTEVVQITSFLCLKKERKLVIMFFKKSLLCIVYILYDGFV